MTNAGVQTDSITINALCQGGLWDWGLRETRAGGLTAVNLTVAVTEEPGAAMSRIADLLRTVDLPDLRGHFRIVESVHDILACAEEGRTGVIIGFQGADPLGEEPYMLDVYYRIGLRVLQLTYQRRNRLGDGCGEPNPAGLSLFGREVVRRCNELGILIDVSHVGYASTMEAIELSRAPVAVTHANIAALNPIARNKTDDVIKALAERGGVFGVTALSRLITAEGTKRPATIDEFVDQIDHIVDLVGVDYVGIGLDVLEKLSDEEVKRRHHGWFARYPEMKFGGEPDRETYFVDGLSSSESFPVLRESLERRGYAAADIEKVLGGNFLRVFGAAWEPISTEASPGA